jgi:hypothetical protein
VREERGEVLLLEIGPTMEVIKEPKIEGVVTNGIEGWW